MTEWTLAYDGFLPREEALREALCTLGNGYFATRGAAEESEAGEIHYPGTYLAGGYNRLPTDIAGRVVENEDLVNMPNWLPLSFRPEGGDWLNLLAMEVIEYRQELDLRRGLLRRRVRVRDRRGRETSLLSRRLVHMGDPHLAAIVWELRAENWSGRVEIRSALDGRVINGGVPRYRALSSRHLGSAETREIAGDALLLVTETTQSRLRIAQAARLRAFRRDAPAAPAVRHVAQEEGCITEHILLDIAEGETLRIEKVVALHCSRDRAISEPATAAKERILQVADCDALFQTQTSIWGMLWRRCDVVLQGQVRTQMVLRLHIFHLLQVVCHNTVDLDVGVPARGLHGEAYRGHIFWDELFIFPFLNLRIPELTRALLHYRWRRLPEARRLAAQAGYRGAMYPWQSGSNGREESQVLHLNPRSGRWLPDDTFLQRHVNAAIAYNVWRYYAASGDREFLSYYGAEILLEIARLWASMAVLDPVRDRYVIRGVVGPDEFHTRYPGADAPGIDNNAYTNVMAAWVLMRAQEALDLMEPDRRHELTELLGLTDAELEQWKVIGQRIYVPFHDDGIISQFEGYEMLAELDWDAYRTRYGDIHRLDRILEAEGDSVNRYKVSKQADVLMLFYLFSTEELSEILGRLGYAFDGAMIPRNVAYYLRRTSHGSTLSRIVHSWVLARSDRARSWTLLEEALLSDLADTQGGTTAEGIHLGAMSGTVDLVQRGQTGLEVREDLLRLNPCIPSELQGLQLRLRYRGHWLEIEMSCERLVVSAPDGWGGPNRIVVRDEEHAFGPGVRLEFRCHMEGSGWRPAASEAVRDRSLDGNMTGGRDGI